ncbi:MAG: ABC transporter ATP-binding protein [Halanaerobiales bacterium]|nr:ABC transporter ATP-binding protein [Halanaerobiales bacterium]
MLTVKDLHVSYGNIQAIRGISFDVKEKEIVTLIGSNGAGKTSTLRSISNLNPKSGGTVTFLDKDITNLEASQIVKMGICHIPEGRHIFSHLTVEENLIMGDFGNTNDNPNRIKDNLEIVYELFPRLFERKKQNGGTLSGGEQQMLAIGRGLMLDPKLIMMDEPSLGLAPIIVEQIFELVLRIRDWGKTILLIEQNANMALQIADRGYVLETGEISFSGLAKNLINDPKVAKAYLGMD